MDYVKLDPNGNVKQFPYPLNQLIKDNPETSFPSVISDDIAALFGAFSVIATDPPKFNHTQNISNTAVFKNGAWVETWTITSASPEEIAVRTSEKSSRVRDDRNRKLAECDWTQLVDSPLNPEAKAAWAFYRENLRMVPDQPGFPFNITWPTQPN